MSTEMKSNTRFLLTRFYGGEDRGTCLQITAPIVNVSWDSEGFIQVTKQEAELLAEQLLSFVNDNLEEDE